MTKLTKTLEELLKVQPVQPLMSQMSPVMSVMSPEQAKKLKPSEFVFGSSPSVPSIEVASPSVAPIPTPEVKPVSKPGTKPPEKPSATNVAPGTTEPPAAPPVDKGWLDSIVNNEGLGLALQSLGRGLPAALSGKDQSATIGQLTAAPYQEAQARKEAAEKLKLEQARFDSEKGVKERQVKVEENKAAEDKRQFEARLAFDRDKLNKDIEAAQKTSGVKIDAENAKLLRDTGTETDKRLGMGLNRMANGEKLMRSVTQDAKNKGIIEKGLSGVGGELFKTATIDNDPSKVSVFVNEAIFKNIPNEKDKAILRKYVNGALEFTLGQLRIESGSAISAGEYASNFQTILPSISRTGTEAENSRQTAMGTVYGLVPPALKFNFLQFHPNVLPRHVIDAADQQYEKVTGFSEIKNLRLNPSLEVFKKT